MKQYSTAAELDQILRDVIASLPPEVRLAGLTPEERVAGLSPAQRLEGLTPNQREQLRKFLNAREDIADHFPTR